MGHYHNATQAVHGLNQKPGPNLIGLRPELMRSQTNE